MHNTTQQPTVSNLRCISSCHAVPQVSNPTTASFLSFRGGMPPTQLSSIANRCITHNRAQRPFSSTNAAGLLRALPTTPGPVSRDRPCRMPVSDAPVVASQKPMKIIALELDAIYVALLR
ncbi:hypothetical protein DPSP01_008572 [Paraphaeosphaeria sporulosa]